MKRLTLIVLVLLLASCTTSVGPASAPLSPSPLPDEECNWVWGNKSLAELSSQVRTALEEAGLTEFSVSVEAFSSNCLDHNGRINRFDALHTDFYVVLNVETLDRETLGQQTLQILTVLAGFPPESTPGPWPGKIDILFVAGEGTLPVQLSIERAQDVLRLGWTGAELLDALKEQ